MAGGIIHMVTTMQDVANLAGVSAKTVSRVFNNDVRVAPDTRASVQAAMRELRYQPNMLARRFREGRDSVLGVAVPDIGDPFFAVIIRVIEEQAIERGMATIVTTLGQAAERERLGVESLLRRHISGIFIAPVSGDQSYLRTWQDHTPLVFLDRAPGDVSADTVVADDEAQAEAATAHLIRHGHRTIAFVGDTTALVTTSRRLTGYRRALSKAGLPMLDELVVLDARLLSFGYASTADAVADVSRLLAFPDPPTAVFSSNAQCSMGLVAALHALGREDVAFVSFGDFPMAATLDPAITVIDQNPHGLALLACHALFDRIDTPDDARPAQVHTLQLQLIERGSGELPPSQGV